MDAIGEVHIELVDLTQPACIFLALIAAAALAYCQLDLFPGFAFPLVVALVASLGEFALPCRPVGATLSTLLSLSRNVLNKTLSAVVFAFVMPVLFPKWATNGRAGSSLWTRFSWSGGWWPSPSPRCSHGLLANRLRSGLRQAAMNADRPDPLSIGGATP